MKKCHLSIEFAHLYADQYFSVEQQYSLQLACRKSHHAAANGESVATLVMIDDLHASEVRTDALRLRQEISQSGGWVDNIVFESSLIPGSLQFIEYIPQSLVWCETFRRERKQVLFTETVYGPTPLLSIRNGRKIPSCAALSATLLLMRLGELRSIRGVTCAEHAITIIEERFRHLEQSAHALISMTRFAPCLERVETILFEVPEESFLHAA